MVGSEGVVPDLTVTRSQAIEAMVALAILLASGAVAWLVQASLTSLVSRINRSSSRSGVETLSRALRLPVATLIVATGAFIALRTMSWLDPHREELERAWTIAVLVGAVVLLQRVAATSLGRLGEGRAGRAGALRQLTPLAQRAANLAILLIGTLVVLDQLGVSISPLLAGLGIGGLAVALALQPLLTNLFAGWYVLSDASIREGDFITLLNGPAGNVTDIGWRATRLRSADGESVIVPNGMLAAAVVTNAGAELARPVVVSFPVSLRSDLGRVEQTMLAVLDSVVNDAEGAAPESAPQVRFQRVMDGRVECVLTIRARTASDVPALTHLVIKHVQARLRAEGLEIA
ncbi:MAG: mechanosensitive ion channel [Dehalococcoidia bacterium]